MKKEHTAPMDERQLDITRQAIVFGFVFLILCLLIATVCRIVQTGNAGWELFAIIGASLVILIARRLLGDVDQPLDWRNNPLPTEQTREAKKCRRRNYAVNSLIFSATFTVLDLLLVGTGTDETEESALVEMLFPGLNTVATLALTAVLTFVSTFLLVYILEYLVGEYYKVRRYNRMLSQLEAEDSLE